MADRVAVRFRGDGAGTGDLSWGQRELWGGMVQQRSWFPIGLTTPLPPGRTVGDVAAELAFLVSRHQSMRTRLSCGMPGRPRQVVADSGELPLEIVDAGRTDPAEIAAQVERRYRTTDFDFVNEWPVRVAVVRHGGRPTHRVMIMCHLVTDGFGAAVLAADIANRDPLTGESRVPAATMQPLAQARWQGSPAGQRQNQQALRYWQGRLRKIPARRFSGTGEPQRPRYWQARLDSPAMQLAVRAVVARTGVDSSTVLLAAFSVALARTTGISPAVTRVLVSNRFRPGLAAVVAPISQPGLCVVDVDDAGFDEVAARTKRQTMAAYKYAYYDTYQLNDVIERVDQERGEQLDIACFFNDRRSPVSRQPAGQPPDRRQLREALPHTSFRWGERMDRPTERLFLHIEDVPDTVSIAMWADTCHLPPAGIELLLATMERTLVAAAFDPGRAGSPR